MEAIAASVDISPPSHLPAACHGPRNKPSTRIAIPFEANVLALRDDGMLLVIVSLDWFFTSPGMRKRILDRCTGHLDESNLIVAASHTHTSPNTDVTKVGFSAVDGKYVSEVEDAVSQLVEQVLTSGEWHRVHLRLATAPCDCSIHRRRRIWWPEGRGFRKILGYPNPEGPSDQELRLLRVENEDRSLLAVLWGVSCHPTEWPRVGELSSDYPGVVREGLRKREHGGKFPVLFLQGYCGDLRPPALDRWLLRGSWRIRLLMFLCSLVNGPFFAGFSPEQYERWADRIVRSAYQALDDAASQNRLAQGLAVKRITMPLSRIGLSAEIDEVSFTLFDLGEHLRFACVSAEMAWQYAGAVRQMNAEKFVWPVGYVDNVFGYLPTQAMVSEGGYEVTGFGPLFGVKGNFNASTEEAIRSCLFQEPGHDHPQQSDDYAAASA